MPCAIEAPVLTFEPQGEKEGGYLGLALCAYSAAHSYSGLALGASVLMYLHDNI